MIRLKTCAALLAAELMLSVAAWPQTAAAPPPQSADNLAAELDALVAHRQYDRAERMMRARLAAGGDPSVAYFQIGKVYFQHQLWQRSAAFLEKSLALKSSNDEAHQLLGLDWRELHRPDDAETELLEAARENPSNSVNAYFAAQQLLLNGKFEAALPHLYRALDWKPLESQALQALALAQARLGNYGLAESYYRKVIDSTPTSREGQYSALINLSILLLLGHDPVRIEAGLSSAQRAEELQPDSPDAHFLVGKALFKLGRVREASEELARAARLNPADSKPHYLLARIYDELGLHDRARHERATLADIRSRPARAGMGTAGPLPVTAERAAADKD